MASRQHNIAAAIALVLLSLFPIFAFQYGAAQSDKPDDQPVYEAIAGWPEAPREAALELIDAYGPPDQATTEALTWHRTQPWEHTIVYRLDSGVAPVMAGESATVQASAHVAPALSHAARSHRRAKR